MSGWRGKRREGGLARTFIAKWRATFVIVLINFTVVVDREKASAIIVMVSRGRDQIGHRKANAVRPSDTIRDDDSHKFTKTPSAIASMWIAGESQRKVSKSRG